MSFADYTDKEKTDNQKSRRARYLECGKVINTHGLDGTVKLDVWCDSPNALASLKRLYVKEGDSFSERRVQRASVQKRFVLAKLEGVDGPEAADSLRDTVLYADRDDIPVAPGAHFIADLIGLPVVDADSGVEYGTLCHVFNAGASDVYTIDTPTGERMMPAVPEFVVSIDIDKAIYVRPIEGMFEP